MSEKMQPMTREQLVKRVAYFRDRCYHWHQVAKKWRKNFHYMANEAKLAYEDKQNADRLAASHLELLMRAAEFLEINNPVLKEIKKELGDD